MIITCDAYCSMGYIYLQPPNKKISEYHETKENSIANYVDLSSLHIPLLTDMCMEQLLETMRLSYQTYREAVGTEVGEEYKNDLDDNGYIIGVELNLSKEKFIDLVANGAYKLYKTEWRSFPYHIATFDHQHKVFDSNNVIYPLSQRNDVFLIIEITKQYNIGLVKALISRRDDLYPVDYFLSPQFILSEYTL
ncbi:hypothetical protein [Brevibacillus porteri]|uniref:Uncharacterized protein n=1 Tax=Brevibacillus porteri TaxID=2126350 RepID=A0ABX5FGG0_9BACL|nr:hypothetical protein [Brevibacillus porteri]MED1801999.1 hypothetical protein [Brevibacillus porteri]MED2132560.1 hypothetical protein [Brevibacillus porteri]MED2745440.1 hypothetical protein [Brevibacillus porteri]MED2814283.1 hypothetical protein [Brevibacillus porteri]MED2892532.1 hypothetical protein [Brevibacillus porteri]